MGKSIKNRSWKATNERRRRLLLRRRREDLW
uniref:Uncharacterized protein n=1 Tax=Arundo donax TaxID=35708 RepID=A0A0A9GYQ2_ARUDO